MKKLLIFLLLPLCATAQNGSYHIKSNGNGYSAFSPQVISLKQRGILSDADLSFGSSSFGTDQTTAIQSILNTASASNPLYIIWDVKVSDTGLVLKSNTYIQALPGCGAILRDSSNNFLFRNYGWVAGLNNIVDSNITIDGGIWNGNGFRGGVGKQLHSNASKGMVCGMFFFGVKNSSIINAHLLNTRTWGIVYTTCANIYLNNLIIDDGLAPVVNQDGISILGYAKNITISNISIRNGDDKLVFAGTCAGGSIASEHHEPLTGVQGDQNGINCSNIFCDSLGKGIAFYQTGATKMQNYTFSNMYGKCLTNWFGAFNYVPLTGYTFNTGSYTIQGVKCENIEVEILSKYGYDNSGYPLATLATNMEDVTFDNVKRLDQSYNVATIGTYKFGGVSVTIKNLTIKNFKSLNSSPSNAINQVYINNATVNTLNLNGEVDLGSSTQNCAFMNVTSTGTVTNILAAQNRAHGLKYFINNAGTITNANVVGLTHTGQGGSDPTVINSGTFTTLVMNGWIGVVATSGTFGSATNGNAF